MREKSSKNRFTHILVSYYSSSLDKQEYEKTKDKRESEGINRTMGGINKEAIQKQFQRHESDTGSSDVQVALLSKRIEMLTEHLKTHKKDHSSRFGLIKMVSARRRLLDYLKQKDRKRYEKLIKELGIRR